MTTKTKFTKPFFIRLFYSLWGRTLWVLLQKKYGKSCDVVRYILFPEADEEYTLMAIDLLPYYMRVNQIQHAILIAENKRWEEEFHTVAKDNRCSFVFLTRSGMKALIQYAALVNMSRKWIIVSVKQPYDTGAESLLGKEDINKQDIIWYDIFRLDDV